METQNLKNEINNLSNLINKLFEKIDDINDRINIIEENSKKIEENLINELHLSAMPLINSSIDASKPELRNYINMIVKEEFRIRG